MEQSFATPDEAIQYWRQLAAERKDDFDELKEMGEGLTLIKLFKKIFKIN